MSYQVPVYTQAILPPGGCQLYDQPPVYQPIEESNEIRLKRICAKYEISQTFQNKLKQLEGCEIVLLWDNSGSMLNSVQSDNPKIKTRWDESCHTAEVLVDLATIYDPTGIDLYFLNEKPGEQPHRNLKSPDEVRKLFNRQPDGYTPTCRVLRQIFEDKKHIIKERKLIVIIGTDGLPTNDQGDSDIQSLEEILRYERPMKDL